VVGSPELVKIVSVWPACTSILALAPIFKMA